MMFGGQQHRRSRATRGFTLVELLVTVVAMGILTIVGLTAFDQKRDDTKIVQAEAVCRSIAGAQRAYKSFNHSFLDVSSSLTNYYPDSNPTVEPKRWEWGVATHTDSAAWARLGPTVPVAVRYRFATVAGLPGDSWPTLATTETPSWPTNQVDPWFVVQAIGDLDGDNNYSVMVVNSFNNLAYMENRGE